MKKTLIPVAALGAAAGLVLRRLQLANSYDAANLIPRGDKISLALYLVCALAAAALLALCLRESAGTHAKAGKSALRGLLVIAAALGLLGSHLPPDLTGGIKLLVLPALAFASACAMAVEGLYHRGGETGSLLGGCLLPVYLAASLISDYRAWSHDPMVADFCFPLLFLVAAMLASYHLAAFRVGRGKRRTTAFLVGCALVFAGPVLADGGWRPVLRTLAICLYLGAELWPYLAKPEPLPADPVPAPAPEDETAPAPGDETAPAPGDETAPAPGDETAPASEDETAPAAEQ